MPVKKQEFKTDLKDLLHLIVNSLYSNKEIFLRELVSNACDAIDKVRFEALTNANLLEGNDQWKIKMVMDKKKNTLTLSDNGIGMNRETIAEDLGTIARSGTKAFLNELKAADVKDRPDLIGQFGVGFYSSFMVAEKVTVISRIAGKPENGVKWESDGKGEFTIEKVPKESRGTDVILHLKKDETEFLDDWKLRELVKKYSDFVEHPIVIDVEKEDEKNKKKKKIEEETLNSRKAIWIRSKSDIKPEEYKEFYQNVSKNFDDPLETIHYSAEGTLEFKALLFFPSKKPFDLFTPDNKIGLKLYIQRVFIMDNCEALLPEYLRFVKGVVDSSDLPLNVSREILQNNPVLAKIRKNLINKIFGSLKTLMKKDRQKFEAFFKEFGPVLKEGIHTDFENKEKLADLCLFESSKTEAGKYVDLNTYLNAMQSDQKEIFVLTGETRLQLETSPYLESFKAKGQEVLFLTDPIDEWVLQGLSEYKGKKLKAIDKGEMDLDKAEKKKQKDADKKYKGFLEALSEKLDGVKEVRFSSRLKESASCLVADEYGMTAHMERLMKQFNQDGNSMPESKRILELNPDHQAVKAVINLYEKDSKHSKIENYGRLFYDQAVLAEGSKLKDPAGMAKRVNDLLTHEAEALLQ